MKCPHCNQEHPDGFQFCPTTGQKINALKACSNKGCPDFGKNILPVDSMFCPRCGSKLEGTIDNPDGNEKIFTINGVSFKMIKVVGGTFDMGDGENSDAPTHEVTLTRDYYIGETVVTNELALAVLTDDGVESEIEDEFGSYYDDDVKEEMEDNPEFPFVNINWHEAKWFIRLLKKITGEKFDLPTEAEWEFAARGGNKSENYLYSGSDDLDDVAWYNDNSDNEMQDVAGKDANELGIYDMSGLVGEWCSDWYDEDYYDDSPSNNPKGPKDGEHKVIRGGSINLEEECGTCWRGDHDPDDYDTEIGIRLVLRIRK